MKEKLIVFTLIFSLTINVAALLTMGYFWGREQTTVPDRFTGRQPPSLTSGLSLDTRQRGKMRGLRRAFLQETAPVQDALLMKRGELANHLAAESPDRPAINRTLREINELQLQIQIAVIDNLLREKAFLKPGQQKQYGALICNELCQGRCATVPGAGDCRCSPGGEGRWGTERGSGAGRGSGEGRGSGAGRGRGEGGGRWQ